MQKAKAGGNESDDLDASEEEAPATKKKKLSKAAEAKLKAKAKANARKKGVRVSDDDDFEEEDEYTAPSKNAAAAAPPPVGSFEECASCDTQFTVVRQSLWPARGRSHLADAVHDGGATWPRLALPRMRKGCGFGPVQEACCTAQAQGADGEAQDRQL